jgi:hypothetical protein
VNVLDTLPQKLQGEARALLTQIPDAATRAEAERQQTTNVAESPFAAVRLRTSAAKRFEKVENATAVIWKTLGVAEQRFRRLDAPELLSDVAEGVGVWRRPNGRAIS